MLYQDYPDYKPAEEDNLWAWLKRLVTGEPHLVLFNYYGDGNRDAQLRRWWVIPRNSFFNIYLHQILRSDDDRALHDHPWASVSFLLKGNLHEIVKVEGDDLQILRAPRHFFPYYRSPELAHRLVIFDGQPCWTLFITGRKARDWGFFCESGWRSHTIFRTKGCGE
jgi:hypothetical protein